MSQYQHEKINYILPNISTEQHMITQELEKNNVVVDSVAGSGKTTNIIYIANHFKVWNILLLTYNSKLKLETREKVLFLGLNNLEVHSYHSFCVKYYNHTCHNDTVIKKIVDTNTKTKRKYKYDLIILDESQDITVLYYTLICKIYKNNNNSKICLFGDKNQTIFDFNGADQRFLVYAERLFNFNNNLWSRCNLSESFRVTREMALFINNCLLKEDRIVSNKITGNKPRYIICNSFGYRLLEEVKYYFSLGYKPSDIFILAPSIKNKKTPTRHLENKIKLFFPDVMVYVPSSEEEKIDEEVVKNKMIFSTFHQTKGLERKVAIVFSFDEYYYKIYKKHSDPTICCNELYVATTRASEHLTIIHDKKKNYFQFLPVEQLEKYCYIEGQELLTKEDNNQPEQYINTKSVTELLRHVPQSIIDEFYEKLDIKENNKSDLIELSTKVINKDDGNCENVSEITGIAIPAMIEFRIKKKMTIYDKLQEEKIEQQIFPKSLLSPTPRKYELSKIDLYNIKTDELLYIANCWNSHSSGYNFKTNQITNYSWLPKEKFEKCMSRLETLNISENSIFEHLLEYDVDKNKQISGFIDCIDITNRIIYEFKCVKELKKEHYLQLALYMYIYNKLEIKEEKYKKSQLYQDLFHMKERTLKKIKIQEKYLEESSLGEYSIGDIIKYPEGLGQVIRIYKTTKNIRIITQNDKKIYIPKSIISEVVKSQKKDILSRLEKLKSELDDIENKIEEIEKNRSGFKYVLYNILTDHYCEITCDMNDLTKMVERLFHIKYSKRETIDDKDFIRNNLVVGNKYFR